MERLQERIAVAKMALRTLEEVMRIAEPSAIERDAAIQRFEYTFEALWKAGKQMLFAVEGMDVGSPKGVVRACWEVGMLDENETIKALEMVDDRNLTVHTYNEVLAEAIYERIKDYVLLMRNWIDRIEERVQAIK